MDTKKVIIYVIAGGIVVYCGKKLYDMTAKPVATPKLVVKNFRPVIKDFNENKEIKPAKITSIKYGDSNEKVYTLKQIINYFYGFDLLELNDEYCEDLLEQVQDLFKKSPALYNPKTGEVCANFIDVLDYIIAKQNGHDVSDYEFDENPDIDTCEVIEKGSAKYFKVRDLQKFINTVTENETLEVNGKYSGAMVKIVKDVFGDSNVIRKDANGGICYRFLNAAVIMLKNIDKNVSEYAEDIYPETKEENA